MRSSSGISRSPWRLGVLYGTPPPEVTERESEIAECIAGERTVNECGHCPADDEL